METEQDYQELLNNTHCKIELIKGKLDEARQAKLRLTDMLNDVAEIETILAASLSEEIEKANSLKEKCNLIQNGKDNFSDDDDYEHNLQPADNFQNGGDSNELSNVESILQSTHNDATKINQEVGVQSVRSHSTAANFLPPSVRKYFRGRKYENRKTLQTKLGERIDERCQPGADRLTSVPKSVKPVKQTNYLCLLCNSSFKTLLDKRKHEKEEHQGILVHRTKKQQKMFACPVCGDLFRSCHVMQRHAREEHYAKDPNICDECGKSFISRFNLKAHKRLHSDEKPYECRTCGKDFKTKGQLTKHQYLHTGEKRYKCSLCESVFTYTFQLRIHMTSHTGERPQYVCSECPYECHFRGSLVKHMRTHTGEKPYLCSECGKSFADPSAHKTHLLMHSGLRPFSCQICGKTFRLRGQLNLHQRIHTGEKKYVCSLCGVRYMYSKSLRDHLEKHASTSSALPGCAECKAGFDSEADYEQHMLSHTQHTDSEVLEYFVDGAF